PPDPRPHSRRPPPYKMTEMYESGRNAPVCTFGTICWVGPRYGAAGCDSRVRARGTGVRARGRGRPALRPHAPSHCAADDRVPPEGALPGAGAMFSGPIRSGSSAWRLCPTVPTITTGHEL